MNKKVIISVLLLCAFLGTAVIPAFAEDGAFSFRGGVTFGMGMEKIKEIEEANGQVHLDHWLDGELPPWKVIRGSDKVQVSSYEAYLLYFFLDDMMESVFYDFMFYGDEGPEAAFNNVAASLTAKYGAGEPVSSAEIVNLVNHFSPNFYSEEDLVSVTVWRQENVDIYQFYYSENGFVLFYANPAFDYGAGGAVVDTTGL